MTDEEKKGKNPWAGRFTADVDPLVQRYTRSIHFDKRLAFHDLRGSRAHVRMLSRRGILSSESAEAILSGLDQVEGEIEGGRFPYRDELEDIHMNIEVRLGELIGEVADRLHTGRSRNDQVAVDLKLYCLEVAREWKGKIFLAISPIVKLAEKHQEDLMPASTHLQAAQPIPWAHYFMSYCEMLERDYRRLCNFEEMHSVSPLGAGALSGSSLNLDPEMTAQDLGFTRSFRNSYDVVGDRDAVLELIQIATQIMIHLSRMAEDLIYFTSTPLRWIDLPDSVCTGSSMMPQKKNPDLLELMRGKSASVIGHVTALASLLKGLPTSYNRDLQQDKEHLFPAVDVVSESLEVLALAMSGLRVDVEKSHQALGKGFLMATELAEYLVEEGIPFRKAHHQVGKLVAYCVAKQVDLHELSLDQVRESLPEVKEEVLEVLRPEAAIARRRYCGSAGRDSVRRQLKVWNEWIESTGCSEVD